MYNVPALRRSHPAMVDLSNLCNDQEVKLCIGHVPSLDSRTRDQGRFSCFRIAPIGRDGDGLFRSIWSITRKTLGKVVDAVKPKEYDVLFSRRKGFVKVPRGCPVSEREWAASESGRKVKFSPRIGVSVRTVVDEQKIKDLVNNPSCQCRVVVRDK